MYTTPLPQRKCLYPYVFAGPCSWSLHSSKIWTPLSSSPPPLPLTTSLTLISWNIDFASWHSCQRILRALSHLSSILPSPPTHTLILLQEVHPSALAALLKDVWVQDHFLVTDTHPVGRYFTLTLMTRDIPIRSVRRVPFRMSRMQRDVLFVDIAHEGGVLRVGNTHLESLPEPGVMLRPMQLGVIAGLLKEEAVGVVAGDMNAICPEDDGIVEKVGLQDAWQTTRVEEAGDEVGNTWGYQPRCRFAPGRLDKILFTGNVRFDEGVKRVGVGLEYEPPAGEEGLGRGGKQWVSDHYGLMVKPGVEEGKGAFD